ncbi:MAG: hypothetical protein QW041_01090 [Candidatus Pacearchaeota archaeon]
MQIVGFTLTKILIDRKNDMKGKFQVSSKIDIKDVKEEKIKLVENKDVLKFDFEYSINYEPELAELLFRGFILVMAEPKEAKGILEEWKKKKILESDIKLRVFNTIFHKCNIKALELEEDFNLPPHLRLPIIRPEEEKTSKSSTYTG